MLTKYNIKKPNGARVNNDLIYKNKDYLYQEHVVKHRTLADIAKENNVSNDTIARYIRLNGMDVQTYAPQSFFSDEDIEKIKELYCVKKMSANKISKMFDTDHETIIRHLKKNGVEIRSDSEAQFAARKKEKPKELSDPVYLFKTHWLDMVSCKDMAKQIGVDANSVRRAMKKWGIVSRNSAESKIGLMVGELHPNWKGGISELNSLLREYFTTNLAPIAAKRDNYTCQLCGETHVVLHVHHIRPLSKIVKEILNEHGDLNLTNQDDKTQLYSIITNDERFLDINNLITYCKDCHFYKIHKYKKRISSQASKEEGSETIP